MPDSLQPQGLYSPWNFPDHYPGVDSPSHSSGPNQPRNWTRVSCMAGRFFFFFFILFNLFFNWRIIALQNCVVFCQTSTWIGHRYTHIPSLLNLPPITPTSHPSRLIQSPCLSFLRHKAAGRFFINWTILGKPKVLFVCLCWVLVVSCGI